MVQNKQTEMAVSDAITQKPIEFTIGDTKFSINPPTIGKMQVLSKLYLQLDIDDKAFDEAPHKEAMRVCESKADVVSRLMAVATFDSKEDLLDEDKLSERAGFFKWNCHPQDFSTCLLAMLTQVDYMGFISSIRLTEMLRQNKPNTVGMGRVEQ